MKKVVLFLAILFFNTNCIKAQNLKYEEIIKVDSSLKSELYSRAKEWIVHTFNSAKDVIQLDDSNNGEVIAKGISTFSGNLKAGTGSHNVNFILTILVKDNRYKYIVSDIIDKHPVQNGSIDTPIDSTLVTGFWGIGKKEIQLKSMDAIQQIIHSLKFSMSKKSVSDSF